MNLVQPPEVPQPPEVGAIVRTQGGRLGVVEKYIDAHATVAKHNACPDCNCRVPAPYQGFAVVRWLDAERVDGTFIRYLTPVDLAQGHPVPEDRQVRSYEWPITLTRVRGPIT